MCTACFLFPQQQQQQQTTKYKDHYNNNASSSGSGSASHLLATNNQFSIISNKIYNPYSKTSMQSLQRTLVNLDKHDGLNLL